MANLKNHGGMWLRDDAAAAINALEDKYGVIRINSAGRTVAEQNDLIRRFDRGEPGIYNPARPAERSNHVRNGGIAVDVYNYNSDEGKLNEFGFYRTDPGGDPVHYEFRGWNGGGSAPASNNGSRPNPIDVMRALNWRGIAAMLRGTGRYQGDNVPGPQMFTAFQRFLNEAGYSNAVFNRGIDTDGRPGDETAKAMQQWLKSRWGYSGDIDAWLGSGTIEAWNRAENANWNEFPGNQLWP